MNDIQPRHCWACMRRRKVCDFVRPSCTKCVEAGIVCPGYDENKPLRWVEPGSVVSRRRRKKGKASLVSKDGEVIGSNNSETTSSCSEDGHRSLIVGERSSNKGKKRTLSEGQTTSEVMHSKSPRSLFEGIPRKIWNDESTEIVHAINFFNEHMQPGLLNMYSMAPSPFITPISLEVVPYLPPIISHSIVIITVGSRVHRKELPGKELWPKIYQYRGMAIRDLNETISQYDMNQTIISPKQKLVVDRIILSVIIFLSAELQQCASMDWRQHVDAVANLISIRGGLTKLWNDSQLLKPGLISYVMLSNFGSSTSPPTTYMPRLPYTELLSVPDEIYKDVFSYCLCPKYIFNKMMNINQFRSYITKGIMPAAEGHGAAFTLLLEIEAFSPEQWAMFSVEFYEEFLMMATMFQSATILYCIFSLHHGMLEVDSQIQAMRATHADRLFDVLGKAILQERLRFFIIWPLVVAGVEAASRGPNVQTYIDDHLTSMSREHGTCTTLLARQTLRRFWKSGRTGWDDCFDSPHAFSW